jgi:beta-N-acetylhexosaminidase
MDELDRLVAACTMPAFLGGEPPDWVHEALDDRLAGVCLYGHNLYDETSVSRCATAVLRTAPDALVALDEEGGDVTRLDYLTGSRYPGNLALGVVDDLALTEEVASSVAADLLAAGVNVDFAPSVDVNSDARNPVIGVRSFGADTAAVSAHGAAFVRGLQRGGVAAAAKHFPGHGDTGVDSHLSLPVVDVDETTFRKRDLPPFAAAVEADVAMVMTSHIVVSALDDRPATISPPILTGLLRDELGFDGVVVTDALDMAGVRAGHGIVGAGVLALAAGADLLLLGAEEGEHILRDLRQRVRSAVSEGVVTTARLEQAAARVETLRARLASAAGRMPAPRSQAGPDVGLEAARRAIRRSGTFPLAGPLLVAELRGTANMAVGEARWGLADGLRAAGAVAVHREVEEGGLTPEAVLAQASGVRLVVVVRDAYRTDWQREWVQRVTAERPDAVLVILGMPDDRTLAGDAWLLTHGAARVNAQAGVEVLLGR